MKRDARAALRTLRPLVEAVAALARAVAARPADATPARARREGKPRSATEAPKRATKRPRGRGDARRAPERT